LYTNEWRHYACSFVWILITSPSFVWILINKWGGGHPPPQTPPPHTPPPHTTSSTTSNKRVERYLCYY
jgi:hypothetical protein